MKRLHRSIYIFDAIDCATSEPSVCTGPLREGKRRRYCPIDIAGNTESSLREHKHGIFGVPVWKQLSRYHNPQFLAVLFNPLRRTRMNSPLTLHQHCFAINPKMAKKPALDTVNPGVPLTKRRDDATEIHHDLYLGDKCDAGPRLVLSSVELSGNVGKRVQHLVSCFNEALHLCVSGKTNEAMQLFETVACATQEMLTYSTLKPSSTLVDLALRASNNVGCLGYRLGMEEVSYLFLETAARLAFHLPNRTHEQQEMYATILSNLGRVMWVQGDVTDRLHNTLLEVLRIRSVVLPKDHVDVVAIKYNLAVVAYTRQDREAAKAGLEEYLDSVSKLSEQGKDSGLDTVAALAMLLLIRNEEKTTTAEQELVEGLRALLSKRQKLGPHCLEVAAVLNLVGTQLFHLQDFESALAFFREELRIEDSYSRMHQRDVCTFVVDDKQASLNVTCNNIGRILQELGRMKEAVKYYRRALESEYGSLPEALFACKKGPCEQVFCCSKCAPLPRPSAVNLCSTVWYNLGIIYDKLGSHNEAIASFQMSLELRRVLLGYFHPDISCLLYNIGVLQMEQKRLSEASISFRDALSIHRLSSTGQLDDRHIVRTLEKLAELHKSEGNIKAALETLNQVLEVFECSSEYGLFERLKEIGSVLRCVAELHHADGALDHSVQISLQSIEKLRLALDLVRNQVNCGVDCPQSAVLEYISTAELAASSMMLLGSLFHEKCEPVKAQAILVETLAVVKQTVSVAKICDLPAIPPALYSLGEVAELLSNKQAAPAA